MHCDGKAAGSMTRDRVSVLCCGLAAQMSLKYKGREAASQKRRADGRDEGGRDGNGEYITFLIVIV